MRFFSTGVKSLERIKPPKVTTTAISSSPPKPSATFSSAGLHQ